jgi:hypothetical protein
MDPRDDDIDFDFFEDEAATREAQAPAARVRLPRRGGSGGNKRRVAGPPRGLTPFLRLLGAVAILVAILVFFGLAIQSCASTSTHDQYASYMADASKIAKSSEDNGAQVTKALTTSGSKPAAIATQLDGIAQSEHQNLEAARKLSPPGAIRPENLQLQESLQLRISGVEGMAKTMQQVAKATSTKGYAATLADQASRLTASDVVWSDLFQQPANAQMAKDGVKGVQAPSSQFVADDSLVSEHEMSLILGRVKGSSSSSSSSGSGATPTGSHGSALVSVQALPSGQVLSQTQQNTVTAGTDLGFKVTVENSGGSQEVGIEVTLTIQQTPAIVKTQRIQVINPGEQQAVTFKNLGDVKFARPETLSVNIAAVPGETNLNNNRGTFSVIFSLG